MAKQIKPHQRSSKQKAFEEKRKDWTDREIQMELLYAQQIQIDKLDSIKSNIMLLVVFFIVIPIIAWFLLGAFS